MNALKYARIFVAFIVVAMAGNAATKCALADDEQGGVRVALVIGNSDYRAVPDLPNTLSDAELTGTALRAAGFSDITIVKNSSRGEMTLALQKFAEKADHADWALVFYAGHGLELAGENYLIPTDARLRDERDVEDEAIPLDRVLRSISGARTVRLVILDACRDNPFLARMRYAGGAKRSVGRGLARVERNDSTLVLFSAEEGMVADDGKGANSPFTASFARHILDPGVEVGRMLRIVSSEVATLTDQSQRPVFYGTLPPDELYFVASKSSTAGSQTIVTPPPSADHGTGGRIDDWHEDGGGWTGTIRFGPPE